MNTQSGVKDWKKSIEGQIRHHMVLIIAIAMAI